MRHALLAICLHLVCGPLLAQSTAAIGRLFTTPDERVQLDALRHGGASGLQTMPAETPPAPPPPMAAGESAPPAPAEPLQLNGVIRRSGGKSVIWVNNAPLEGPSPRAKNGTLSLPLPAGGSVRLKPGQSYNPADGSVHEAGR